jgi:hypothetical protein
MNTFQPTEETQDDKEMMERPTHIKAEKACNVVYPVGADGDLLRTSFLALLLVFPAIN